MWLPLEEYLQPTFDSLESSSVVSKQKAEDAIRNAWYSEHIRFKAQEAVWKWPSKLRECVSQKGKIISRDKWRLLIGPFNMQLRVLYSSENKHSIGVKYSLNRPEKACEKALVSVQ